MVAIIGRAVDPSRKRKIRLVVALSAAVLLAAGLVYTSRSFVGEDGRERLFDRDHGSSPWLL